MATISKQLIGSGLAVLLAASPHFASAAGREADAPRASCIAIVMPTVQGIPGNAEEAASGVRDLIMKYLTGPSVKLVALESRLPSQAADEAKAKGCEPVLYAGVTRKTGGGRFAKALGQAAGNSAWFLPGGSTAASAAARAGAAAGLQTASSLAASTKAKDAMRLEYRLQSSAGQVEFGPKTESQTASADGEDLLTPIVMRAAEALVTRGAAK
jgi:hypothetical protein